MVSIKRDSNNRNRVAGSNKLNGLVFMFVPAMSIWRFTEMPEDVSANINVA